ncbi:MAG: hypothetical protein K6T75_00940 [Acetobacteraceae bacterium]|nr:hypothetical protein [Acetobacteraceae bacterium]
MAAGGAGAKPFGLRWGGRRDLKPQAFPIRTRILTPDDDLIQVLREYAGPLLGRGSVVAVSETALAILQGRFVRPERVRPGPLARFLARFVSRTGSLSSPFALQLVMQEHGRARVALAFLVGVITRLLLGRSGDLYRIAGPQASLVDDVTGTLPPYDKHIVLGPKDPQRVVEEIRRRTGSEAAVIDANDLGGVSIVAATRGVNRAHLREVFRTNPWGNGDEQTPILILRYSTSSAPPPRLRGLAS